MNSRAIIRIAILLLLAMVAVGRPASALEATAFLSGAGPTDIWGGGAGAALSITLFDVAGLEVEGARQSGETSGTSMVSLSGRAFLAPSFGKLVPYAGLSIGVRREATLDQSDWGTLRGEFIGVKLKLPAGLRLRGEYQWVHLPDDALVPMDKRFYAGVGFAF